MKRALIPLVLLTILVLSGVAPSAAHSGSSRPAEAAVAVNAPSAPTGTASQSPGAAVPVNAPTAQPVAVATPVSSESQGLTGAPHPADAQVVMGPPQVEAPLQASDVSNGKWYIKSPGTPLVTDDPAEKGKRVIMLTFDDGPGPYTAQILDILKQNNVRAMFFITGNAMKHPDLVEREYRDGHILGVHTVSHADLTKLTPEGMRKEIGPIVDVIQKVTGKPPRYLRPPYGSYNKEVIAVVGEYGMQVINWTTGSLDWDGLDANGWKDPKLVVDQVMKTAYKGSVVLMHDIHKHTLVALPELIKELRAAGYEFVTLQ